MKYKTDQRVKGELEKETHTHTHTCDPLVGTVGSFGSVCTAVTLHISMHLHCFTLFNLTVCVCGKALYCVQSRAPILSQWSRAKGLNDPHLTQTLPLCVHVHAGGRCHLVLRIMNVCVCVSVGTHTKKTK